MADRSIRQGPGNDERQSQSTTGVRSLGQRDHASANTGGDRSSLLQAMAGPTSTASVTLSLTFPTGRIEAFPTVQILSEASLDQVNSLWKGLGYYSRAFRLLDGAKTVVNKYKGRLPSDPGELVKQVGGIGPYTAGAIASIAYGVKAPTVDGNVRPSRSDTLACSLFAADSTGSVPLLGHPRGYEEKEYPGSYLGNRRGEHA